MSNRAEPGISIRLPDISELRKAYSDLPKTLAAVSLAAACKRALQPAIGVLRNNSPKGPTGNLRRAVAIKSVTYTKTRTGAAIVGYKKAGAGKSVSAQGGRVRKGSDRAFHQFWLEFGTDERRIKHFSAGGFAIASSFKSRGPFRIKSTSKAAKKARRLRGQAIRLTTRSFKAKFQDEASGAAMMRERARNIMSASALAHGQSRRVQTTPPYPKAFFMAGGLGQPLVLPAMHPTEPVRTTWQQVRGGAADRLEGEMRQGLVNAQKQLAIRAEKANAKKQAALDRAAAGWATLF